MPKLQGGVTCPRVGDANGDLICSDSIFMRRCCWPESRSGIEEIRRGKLANFVGCPGK